MEDGSPGSFQFEETCSSTNNLPDFSPFLDEAEPPVRFGTGNTSTESLDLGYLFAKELTESGSFDFSGVRHTSFGRLLLTLPIPALLINESFIIKFCNEAWLRLSCSHTRIEGQPFSSFFPDRREAAAGYSLLREIFEKRKPKIVEQKLFIDNRIIWTRVYFRPLRSTHERMILCLMEDLTLEKRQVILIDKISRTKRDWELTFDIVPDMIALIDGNYRIHRLNAAMAERAGVPFSKAVGQPCYKLIHGMEKPLPNCPYAKMLNDGRGHSEEYYEERLSAYFMETVSPIKNENGFAVGCVLVARDITDRKRLEKELTYRATHDILTGLFNRSRMMDMLEAACQTASRYELPITLCMCDVDKFKRVNDRYGHQAGDRVLTKFGEILGREVRRADFAGRYAGDEFLIAFPNTHLEGALESIERVRGLMEGSAFKHASETFNVTCSFGMAEFNHGMSLNQLILRADQLLYRAKHEGGNKVAY